jgi:hypothetical protein
MKHLLSLAALAALSSLLLSPAVHAQTRPDFSGSWTLDAARSDPPLAGRGGRGAGRGAGAAPLVVKQTDTEITIGPATYRLDGSESVNAGRGRGGAQQVKSRARWDGARLVIESTREVQGFTVTTREVRTLDANGKDMIVETTIGTPRGDQTLKQVFTRGS